MAKLTPRKKDKIKVRVVPIIKPSFNLKPIFKVLEKKRKGKG
jgi:hypothetical protein